MTNSLAFLALFESFLRTAEHTKPVTKTKSRETQIGSLVLFKTVKQTKHLYEQILMKTIKYKAAYSDHF